MKTLEQIKNEVCQRHGMQNYTELIYTCMDIKQLDDIIKEIVYLSQKECLKLARENANLKKYNTDKFGHKYSDGLVDGVSLHDGSLYEVNKESITNENNIIK